MRRARIVCLVGLLSCAPPDGTSVPSASAVGPGVVPVHTTSEAAPESASAAPADARTGEGLPVGSVVPKSVAAMQDARVPFVLVLHGYGGNGSGFARHFQLSRVAEKRKLIYLAPDGEPDARGSRFWNAGPACCNFSDLSIDHVRALGTIVEQARQSPRIDADRIYVVGYSNGGFMAHRLGCDVPGIRGILSVAGAGVADPSQCKHAPAIVLEVHGDADAAVPFEGGTVLSRKDVPAHPGALETISGWATKKGCRSTAKSVGSFDLEPGLPGAETERLSFDCAPDVALMKVKGAGHSLAASEAAIDALMDQLMK